MKLIYVHTNDLLLFGKKNHPGFSAWIFLLFALFSHSISVKAESEVSFEKLWPKLEQPWYFDKPNDIALDNKRGFAYISNESNNTISKYTHYGEFVKSWTLTSHSGAAKPAAIAVDQEGFIYVAHLEASRIQKFDSNGEYIDDFLRDWTTDSGIDLGFIRGLAFAADGSLYLVCGGQKETDASQAVWHFTQDGKFIESWGEFGNEPGKLGSILANGTHRIGPQDIAISKSGLVYIADTFNRRVQVFSLSGKFITGWGEEGIGDGQFITPISIIVDQKNRVYVGDSNWRAEQVQRFTAEGLFIDRFYTLAGQPYGLAFNSDNILFVADQQTDRIFQLNTEGELISSWQGASDKDGHFNGPLGIDTDANGNVYVVDTGNKRVQRFSSSGTLTEIWQGSDYAFDRGRFDDAEYIAIGQNAFYLAESDRVIKFNLEGKFIANLIDAADLGIVRGITIDNKENIYLSFLIVNQDPDYFQGIAKFTNSGELLDRWQWKSTNAGGPRGLEVGNDGFLYAVFNHKIHKIDLNGNLVDAWAVAPVPVDCTVEPKPDECNDAFEPGVRAGYSIPPDVAIDANGLIYTVNNEKLIRVFNSTGELVNEFAPRGGAPGSINTPRGLSISQGKLYVSDTLNHRIQIFYLGLGGGIPKNTIPYKAIIVAGGGPFPRNLIWNGTQILANRAYSALRFQGFAKDQIKYLTAGSALIDLDNNGDSTDDVEQATKDSLQKAITEWAVDANDVVIYMIDHGGPGRFQINADEILGTQDLKNWIDQLTDKISGKVTVLIEACKSGSFIPAITNTDRYIMSSSNAIQPAIISNKGLNAFSYFFWNEISNGANLQHAFRQGRQAMSSQLVNGTLQSAQLDTTGDGNFSAEDYAELGEYCLGKCTTYAASAPRILNTTSSTTLQGETSLNLQMQIQSLDNMLNAWATIVRPDYRHPDSNEPISDLPRIQFSCDNNGFCTGQYDQFNVTGDYNISFYAQDQEFQLVAPQNITIKQTRSNTTVYDSAFGILTLNDVQVLGQHYRVELLDQGNFNFSVAFDTILPLTESVSIFPANYDDQNQVLSIPRVSASGVDFTVIMSHQGDFVFQLDSVTGFVQ